MSARRWLLVVACVIGCEASPSKPERDPQPPPPRPQASASSPSSSEPPRAAGEIASASAALGDTPEPLAGTWAGRYDAKKGSVTLPPKVKDKGFAGDDGKASVGAGAIELTILPGGEIRGKASGALGNGTIAGKVDGAMIRAVVRPDDPLANNAMTGIFVGERKGDVIACELHVAGPDATTIRESTVELARKK